jgi:hypothetical protein
MLAYAASSASIASRTPGETSRTRRNRSLANSRFCTFHHKATFVTDGSPIEYEYNLRSDAPDVAATEGASLRWDGLALIVTFRTKRPDTEMLVSFRYELLDWGLRLRAIEQVRGTDHDQDNVWIFERR